MVGGVTYNYQMDFETASKDFAAAHNTPAVTSTQDDSSIFPTSTSAKVSETTGNTCTDGLDDGHIGFIEGAKSVGKGVGKFFTNIVNQFKEHPIKSTLITAIGIGVCFIPVVGPFIGAGLAVAGIAGGAYQLGKGIYNAATATTDAEKKDALENVGTGTTTAVVSALALKGSVKQLRSDLGGGSTTVNELISAKNKGATKGELFETALKEGAKETKAKFVNAAEGAYEKYNNVRDGIKEEGVVGYGKTKLGEKITQVKDSKLYKKGKQTVEDGIEYTKNKIDKHQEKVEARKAKRAEKAAAKENGSDVNTPKEKLTPKAKAEIAIKETFGENNNFTVHPDGKSATIDIEGKTCQVEIKHGKPTGKATYTEDGITYTFSFKKGKMKTLSYKPKANADGKIPEGAKGTIKFDKNGEIKSSINSTSEDMVNTSSNTTIKTDKGRFGSKQTTRTSDYNYGADGKKIKAQTDSSTIYADKNGDVTSTSRKTTRFDSEGKLHEVNSSANNTKTGSSYSESRTFGKDGSTRGKYKIGENIYDQDSSRLVKSFAKLDSGRFGTLTEINVPGSKAAYYLNPFMEYAQSAQN